MEQPKGPEVASMATISEALQIALTHHRAGRLELAEEIYRRILVVEPDHADALHLLGVLVGQSGKYEVALECIGLAVRLKGTEPTFHNNLGEAYRGLGAIPEAIACYRRALELKPDYAAAHYNLGMAFKDQGRLEDAIACYRRVVELKPDSAEAFYNLGNFFEDQAEWQQAVACYHQALKLKPDDARAHNNLGNALRKQGRPAWRSLAIAEPWN